MESEGRAEGSLRRVSDGMSVGRTISSGVSGRRQGFSKRLGCKLTIIDVR